MSINFGTDGWRAVISDDFTFDNVAQVAQAITDYVLQEHGIGARVTIGYDTRFLSDRYAALVAEVLAANDLTVYLSQQFCPTPVLSFSVVAQQAQAGVMITASHNPPRYNGIKLKAAYGGSALSSQTKRVEEHLEANLRVGKKPKGATPPYDSALDGHWRNPAIRGFDPTPAYMDHIHGLINFDVIGRSGLRVVVDAMYGAGRGYIGGALRAAGLEVIEIRHELNPGFGGIHPEPIARYLGALSDAVRENQADLGLVTDGDADRTGAVDARGQFVDPHRIYALVFKHLVEQRGLRGAAVKTISTTQMVNILAQRYGLEVFETPVGFNHISDHILARDVLIGGEESGGITIKGHIPEGDGILMGLLLAEIVATRGAPLHIIIEELLADVGQFHYDRRDIKTQPFNKRELVSQLVQDAPATLAGLPIVQVKKDDGVKFLLADDNWLLIRPSGTEPLLRIYAEARTPALVHRLLQAGEALAKV